MADDTQLSKEYDYDDEEAFKKIVEDKIQEGFIYASVIKAVMSFFDPVCNNCFVKIFDTKGLILVIPGKIKEKYMVPGNIILSNHLDQNQKLLYFSKEETSIFLKLFVKS